MCTTDEHRPVRVLLADNHTMFRQSVASMLSADGEVEVVGDSENGPKAVVLAKETQPDVWSSCRSSARLRKRPMSYTPSLRPLLSPRSSY